MKKNKVVALIPARSGSKRLPSKNILPLQNHPLIAYTISAAIGSGIFDSILCLTDSKPYMKIAKHYGAEAPFLRPLDNSSDNSPDIEWVLWALRQLRFAGREFDIFSILRPTSPFRKPETIQRAMKCFEKNQPADSLRAIELCSQHPGKMWRIEGARMHPLMPFTCGETPWHSNQYGALPEIYAQNASLEIAWTRLVFEQKSIAGTAVIPFISEGLEGFDINRPEDWLLAEHYLASGQVKLPAVSQKPYISEK